MPKLQTACTLLVAEGMVVKTETAAGQRRASTCSSSCSPITRSIARFAIRAASANCRTWSSATAPEKAASRKESPHDEKQWSPLVYFDGPAASCAIRCVRVCNEGMGVGALGVINRGVVSEITPNFGDHLECDECGVCIDICPVGALTSGTYRYQTRPWEMTHVGTICTHCARRLQDDSRTSATTRSSAATTATAPASTASSCASRAATPSISRPPRAPAIAADAHGRRVGAKFPGRGPACRGAEVRQDRRDAAAGSASSVPTTPRTKRISTCRSSRARCWVPTTSITTAPATWSPCWTC